jgi:selenocysteine lyase/cysteine desulfurase
MVGVTGLDTFGLVFVSLGAFFLGAGSHLCFFAPRGTGIVWVPERNWGRLSPTIPTFYDGEPFAAWADQRPPNPPTSIAWISPGGFKAFEHQWAMGEAFDFHERIGRERVAGRIAALNSQLKDGLANLPKVKLLTPRDPALSAGITCFEVEGQTASQTVHALHARKVLASTSPYKISKARLAPSLVNDEREVDAALRAVRAVV